jgi:hypothetical protein
MIPTNPDILGRDGGYSALFGGYSVWLYSDTFLAKPNAENFTLISNSWSYSHRGPYLRGTGFVWVDTQDGIVLGGFYFHPTNGEPTPTLAAFSRPLMTKDKSISMSQLPAAFERDMEQWSQESGLPPLTTRYFLTGTNLRILLEHTEDYCYVAGDDPNVPLPPPEGCEQLNADAADLDVTAAYYLEQVNYATNATAWMINGQDQVDWLAVRASTCGRAADPLACRIRVTRQRTHVIVTRAPIRHIAAE